MEEYVNPWQDDLDYFTHPSNSNSDLNKFEELGPSGFFIYKYGTEEEKSGKVNFSGSFDFGTFVHTWMLERETVDDKYILYEGSGPVSENQKGFCQDVVNGLSIVEAYQNNYKTSKKSAAKISEDANATYDALCGWIGTLLMNPHKKRVPQEYYDNAEVD